MSKDPKEVFDPNEKPAYWNDEDELIRKEQDAEWDQEWSALEEDQWNEGERDHWNERENYE